MNDVTNAPSAVSYQPYSEEAGQPRADALEPNLSDINKHLYAIFPPDLAAKNSDAWIEIAVGNPEAGDENGKDANGRDATGPKSGRSFLIFDIEGAAKYAMRMNKQWRNVYVGMALRKDKAGPTGRARKGNVVTGARGWGDFDKEGDDKRVAEALKQKGIEYTELGITGTIPHLRFQLFIALKGNPTPEQLEAVNEAIRDCLGGNGDGVQNCDRVMRLAGTVSYPKPDKVARGYATELTRLVINKNSRAYDPELLIRLLRSNEPRAPGGSMNGKGTYASGPASGPSKAAPAGAGNFWRKVNEAALANLEAWVPEIFGDDTKFEKGTKAYRISSKALGRNLEEDLSISPKGITDWGLDDQGKPGEKAGRYTAIDVVLRHAGAPDERAAAFWLCKRIGFDPEALGWNGGGSGNPEIDRLAQMPMEEYEKTRKQSAKEMGFRVSVLDDMVSQARGSGGGGNEEEANNEIERINADHALVLAGNKAAVMKFEGAATKFKLLQISAFKTWFANQLIRAGDDLVSVGDYWMAHPSRRQYAGIEFAPPGTALPDGYYNLWQGFAVEPKKGDCPKFLAHVKDNVARGNEETFNWIVGWWAQIFQRPSIKMETGLALRGPQGTGKTKVGEVMGSLIGDAHYLAVASPRYITGQFNSHVASLLVMQAEEAFWAGDKKGEGILKDLVSGKAHMLEYKGVDPIRIKNYIRLFVTGNAEWVVPAGFRDRRWAIFDIGEAQMQNNAYFAAIDEEMNNGGREALLFHLLDFDLKQVNLRKIPRTAALLDQQIEGMDAEQAWWFEALMRGSLPSKPLGVTEGDYTCLKDDLFETYVLHARLQGITRRSIETKVGMFLKKQLGAKLEHPRPWVGSPPKQLRCYKMPPLAECRQRFAQQLGQEVDWGEKWETGKWQQNDDWRDALAKAIGGQKKKSIFD